EQLRARVGLDVRTAVSDLEVAGEAYRTQERAVETARERQHVIEAGVRAGAAAPIALAGEAEGRPDRRLTGGRLALRPPAPTARLAALVGAPPGHLEEP